MTQVGESVGIAIDPGGDDKCIFCGEDHQDEKPSTSKFGKKDTKKLKKEGQATTKGDKERMRYYWSPNHPPLVDWSSTPSSYSYGYKAAAHHCLAHSEVIDHEIQGELKDSGYDPDAGGNCIMLPYSKLQFSRARALALLAKWNGGRADAGAVEDMGSLMLKQQRYCLQKHSGGHTKDYFKFCRQKLDDVATQIEMDFCATDEKASKEELKEAAEKREDEVWIAVARTGGQGFVKLYNESFLNPWSRWGNHPSETGPSGDPIKPTDYLNWTGGMLQAFADHPDLQKSIQDEAKEAAASETDGHVS